MGESFSAYAMLVSLDSCEMVLGIQWLSKLGPILWDFEKLKMSLSMREKREVQYHFIMII